jgi:hypothetical protein
MEPRTKQIHSQCTDHKALVAEVDAMKSDQKQSENRRWSLVLAGAGSIVCIIAMVITGGVFIGKLETNAAHAAQNQHDDRGEIRRLREDMLRTERQDAALNQKLYRTMTKIEERLNSLDRRVQTIEQFQIDRRRNRFSRK